PLFEENKSDGMIDRTSERIDTTEKLFGPELHKYTIDEAIADGNAVGFHVDYITTGEFISYESLREAIFNDEKQAHPDQSDRQSERPSYSKTEIEIKKEAKKRTLLEYHDEAHIPEVVTEMIDSWESQSQNRRFNAI